MAGLIRYAIEFLAPKTAGNVCVMTGHVNLTGASTPTDADVDAVLTTLKNWWEAGVGGEVSLANQVANDVGIQRFVAQKVQPTPAGAARAMTSTIVGNAGASILPPQVSVVISLRTALSGRSYRGRMYLPGIAANSIGANGLLTALKQQDIADSAKGFLTACDGLFGGAGELVVYSPTLDHKERVTEIRVGSRTDVQRRRQIKGESYVVGV